MAMKLILILSIQAFIIKNALSQCMYSALPTYRIICPSYTYSSSLLPCVQAVSFPYDRPVRKPGLKWNSLSANKGRGFFKVYSSSPVAPTGISLLSQNLIKGVLAVSGEIPFLGAVSLDGSVPAIGTGEVNYSCGDACNIFRKVEGPLAAFAGYTPTASGALSLPTIPLAPSVP